MVSNISKGLVQIKFENNTTRARSEMSRCSSSQYHISPTDYFVKSPSRASTSQIREEFPENKVEGLKFSTNNVLKGIYKKEDPEITESEMNFEI